MKRSLYCLLVLLLLGPTLVSGQEQAPAAEVDAWIKSLGSDAYPEREAATRALIRRGAALRERLQTDLLTAEDPEVRHRLKYILSNVTPPQFATLLLSASSTSGLRPGDVITHVNGRPTRSAADLRQRLEASSFGLMVRVRRPDGTHEIGPLESHQIQAVSDYVAPRGEPIAEVLRTFQQGDARRAVDLLRELRKSGPLHEAELPSALRGCIWFSAGFTNAARELLQGHEALAQPIYGGQLWDSPSGLDRLLGRKAPFQLEWMLYTEAGDNFQRSQVDYDLRMQRILEPAGRYLDTCVRALQLWHDELRNELNERDHVAGNMLAVAGWMLYDLGLRSECCRLIEPRSVLLRRNNNGGPRKWVRVDTDAWLPYLMGDTQGAVDSFYEYAFAVLADPPRPGDIVYVIQNPKIAARIAFFLYQLPEDKRIDDLAGQVIREKHPILPEYLRWMLRALSHNNQSVIRRDLQQALPLLTGQPGIDGARDVALLEYVQETPQREIFLAALERLQETETEEDLVWREIVEALERLVAGAAQEARQKLEPVKQHPLARTLYQTARFRAEPPAAAAFRDVLRDPLLAVPIQPDDAAWLLLTRQRRLMRFDVASERLTPVNTPTEEWFPNPRTWPWISADDEASRGWVYARRRLVEVQQNGELGVRLNIEPEQITALETLAGPAFQHLVELAEDTASLALPRSGEFLAEDVRANAGLISDPELPEISIARRLPRDKRVGQVVLRGGQQLLLQPDNGTVLTTRWMAEQLGVERLRCTVQAADDSALREAPQLWVFSDQGLLLLDLGTKQLERVALPGDNPHAPVIPESLPYPRREEGYLYCARLPRDGGQVYRIQISDRSVEALDLVNLALPPEYFQTLSRAEIRETIDQQLEQVNLPPLTDLIADAEQRIGSLNRKTE